MARRGLLIILATPSLHKRMLP